MMNRPIQTATSTSSCRWWFLDNCKLTGGDGLAHKSKLSFLLVALASIVLPHNSHQQEVPSNSPQHDIFARSTNRVPTSLEILFCRALAYALRDGTGYWWFELTIRHFASPLEPPPCAAGMPP